jgi:hypothetical protein
MENVRPEPSEHSAPVADSAWQCCFCGKTLRDHGVHLAISDSAGAVQGLRAHMRCLKDRLYSSVPFLDADDEATSTV